LAAVEIRVSCAIVLSSEKTTPPEEEEEEKSKGHPGARGNNTGAPEELLTLDCRQ